MALDYFQADKLALWYEPVIFGLKKVRDHQIGQTE